MKQKIIFIILSFFLFNIDNVLAWNGIKSISGIKYVSRPNSDAQFLMPGYNSIVTFDDGTTRNAAAFCLDSTEYTPSFMNSSNSNILQMDDPNSSNMNAGFYGAYQYFYEMIKNDASNVVLYKAYLEAASRTYLKYINDENKTANVYPSYDICKNAIINGKTDNNLYCFGNKNEYYNGINNFYLNAVAAKNNMGNIKFYSPEVKVEKIDEENFINYNISFELYDDYYSKEKYPSISLGNSSGSISAPSVKFKDIYIYSNNVAMSLEGLKQEGSIVEYSSISSGSDITKDTIIRIKVDKNKIFNFENLKMTINYSWSHPLNPHNLFISFVGTPFQRMFVVVDYLENSNYSFNMENMVTEQVEECKQEGNKFYYKGVETDITDYKLKCGCFKIDKDALTDDFIKDFYNKECPSISPYVPSNDVNYTNDLALCTDNQTDNYLINKEMNSSINKYCNLNCLENINFNDVMGKYSVKAGTYFELNKYPKLIANKNCNVKVDYSTWKSDYDILVTNQVDAMTAWNHADAVSSANSNSVFCPCCSLTEDNVCISCYKTEYSKTYTKYSYDDGVITPDSGSVYWGGCSNISKPSIDSNAQSRFNTITGELRNHFENLKICSSYLYNLGEMDKYYDFKVGLNYYYYQDYNKQDSSGKKYGIKRNDSKPDGNIDDSTLYPNKDSSNEFGNYKDYIDNTQSYIYFSAKNTTSNYAAGLYSNMYDQNINRQVNYGYSFYPTVNKYVDSYTAIINSNETYLNNPILLGKVYDTDVSAIPKSDNDNYFSFSSLGEGNNIYNYYKSVNPKKLNRYCTYEITSDILDKCTGVKCDSSKDKDDLKSKLVYRIVDSNDVDPNNRLGSDNGLKNWNNITGKTVLNEIESSNIFNSENLEYSFTLDSATIKEIRKYNNGCDDNMKNCYNPVKYSYVGDEAGTYSELNCNKYGNECTSKFITELEKNNGYFGNSIATNISGRDKWKYLDYDNEKGYFINIFKKDEVNYESLSTKLENKGVEVTP